MLATDLQALGKTFLYRKVLHYARMNNRIALAVCMSGIAALLLPGGRTAHSRFRLPVPVPLEGCACNIKLQSWAAAVNQPAFSFANIFRVP